MSTTPNFIDLSPEELQALNPRPRLIDVREPHEFTGELGHIPQAELVPLATIEAAAQDWPREQTLVMICRSGKRSAAAAGQLKAMGFEKVYNLVGGMLRWNDEGRERN